MNTLYSRRRLLQQAVLGASAGLTAPLFVDRTFAGLDEQAAGQSEGRKRTGKDDTILVVLQLAGGNDGLNTVVPFGDDAYYNARSRLAVPEKELLLVNDYVGLNKQLPFVHQMFGDGELAIVQGIGYPNPNRSHFRSTEIWQTATDADGVSSTGWLGRYFDSCCAGTEPDPTIGVSITKTQPQSFGAKDNPGISVSQPELYRWIQGARDDQLKEELFNELNQPGDLQKDSSGSSVDSVSGGPAMQTDENNLDFLERVAMEARVSSDRIREIGRGGRGGGAYPGFGLGRSLQLVSRMIKGGLGSRVYYVSHGGFDTHTNQANTHTRLLGELDTALKAFVGDLKEQKNFERVMIMTFSEFGRRVGENANQGTDHGAAAPLFVCGGGVRGGLHGTHPSLTDLHRGDLKFSTDFRSIYSTILERWLGAPSEKILGKKFEEIDLVTGSA